MIPSKIKSIIAILSVGIVSSAVFAAPTPPADVVFKPSFLTGYDALTVGTGFVARLKEDRVFLTAHHLFGPAAGLERDLSPAEAKAFVAALAGSSMNHPEVVLTSSAMLLIPSAKAFDQNDATRDIAAFHLPAYRGTSLALSLIPTKKGDSVYLLARPRGEEKLRLIKAVVSRAGPDSIEYVYDGAGINFAGTSGAPVLNESGDVVGINLGGGDHKGRTFGFANPAVAFVPLVSSALTRLGPAQAAKN